MQRTFLLPSLLSISVLIAAIGAASAATTQELRLNSPVERTITGQDEDTYTVRLEKNQRLKAVADQKGVDVVVQIISPKGEVLATLDSPTGDQGPEPIEWIAAERGVYRIVVKPLDSSTKPGKYEIRLLELRKATRMELDNARSDKELKQGERDWFAARLHGDETALRGLADADYAQVILGSTSQTLDQVIQRVQATLKRNPGLLRSLEADLLDVRPYGDTALVSGHVISTNMRNGSEFKVPSQFVHLWRRQNGKWRLATEEVYAAAPLPQSHRVVPLSEGEMRGCTGRFQSPTGGVIIVERAGDHLVLRTENPGPGLAWELYPENAVEFFTREDDASATFVRDGQGKLIRVLFTVAGQTVRLTPLQ